MPDWSVKPDKPIQQLASGRVKGVYVRVDNYGPCEIVLDVNGTTSAPIPEEGTVFAAFHNLSVRVEGDGGAKGSFEVIRS